MLMCFSFIALGLMLLLSMVPVTDAIEPICKGDPVGFPAHTKGCVRYVRGWDITGAVHKVVAEVDGPCECARLCAAQNTTCRSYVWKFLQDESLVRKCVLYADFLLPYDIQEAFATEDIDADNPHIEDSEESGDLVKSFNLGVVDHIDGGDLTIIGDYVPQCLNAAGTKPDDDCVSGPVWTLANGNVLC